MGRTYNTHMGLNFFFYVQFFFLNLRVMCKLGNVRIYVGKILNLT